MPDRTASILVALTALAAIALPSAARATPPPDENEGPAGRPLSAAERKAIDDKARTEAPPTPIDSDGHRTLPDDEAERQRLLQGLPPEAARKLQAADLDRSGARRTHVGIALLVGAPFLGLISLGPLSLADHPSTELFLGVGAGVALLAAIPGAILVVQGQNRRDEARALWPGISVLPRRHGGVTTGAVTTLTWTF